MSLLLNSSFSGVLSLPAHSVRVFPCLSDEYLVSFGFVKHFGELKGQESDWRLPLRDGHELHLQRFSDRCEVHWDNYSAINDVLNHLVYDAPH